MKNEMDFIEIYDGALSSDKCKEIIDYVDRIDLVPGIIGDGAGYVVDRTAKDAWEVPDTFFNNETFVGNYISKILLEYVRTYVGTHLYLDRIGTWGLENRYNLQKYNPGQGYHYMHCENDTKERSHRVLAWTVYLNDVEDNGGTYFHSYDKVVDAKQGRLLIWPAHWTHHHRGVVSETQTKYIATGWFSFIENQEAEEVYLTPVKDSTDENNLFQKPNPLEYPLHYRPGMGTENVGSFLRSMVMMLRPKRILEIGAGYTTPFLLEGLVNNERVFDDGNLSESYFKDYTYDGKLVVIDNQSMGELRQVEGMKDIIDSKYTEFIEGNFEGKGEELYKKYGQFDFVWFDCGGPEEYLHFIQEYWEYCSHYIYFHFTYRDGKPNSNHKIIRDNIKGNPVIIDIVEPHKKRQGSITLVKKHIVRDH